jgi:hypothetical protein
MKIRKLVNKTLFDKGATPKYSHEVYTIEAVNPPYLKLDSGKAVHYKYVKIVGKCC